jgi:hypothetical protein
MKSQTPQKGLHAHPIRIAARLSDALLASKMVHEKHDMPLQFAILILSDSITSARESLPDTVHMHVLPQA